MAPKERLAARAIVLTPQERVLLMQFRFPWKDRTMWITPGGSLRVEEDARTALRRELREETGLVVHEEGKELWTRNHRLTVADEDILQKERYFLVLTEEFEPKAAWLEKGDETAWFRGFRWWSVQDLPTVSEEFAPTRLGELLRALLRAGPPGDPVSIPV